MTDRLNMCRVCDSQLGTPMFTLADFPAYLVPLPPELARTVVRAPLTLTACVVCGHIQVADPDARVQRLIYEEYYSHYVVDSAEALIPHYRRPFEEFLRILQSQGLLHGTLLEVGCSSGKGIPLFEQFFHGYTGIDPSKRIEIAREEYPHYSFIRGCFPDAMKDEKFGAIVTQFSLEHMADPGAFLAAVLGFANPETVLIVQVPDSEFPVRRGLPCFVAHEHIHYFRRATLQRLLVGRGFDILGWGELGPSLICAARPKRLDRVAVTELIESDVLAVAREQVRLFANRPTLPETPLVFYGVGPVLHWLLLDVAPCIPVHVVDDNPAYHGLGLPGYEHIVEPLTAERLIKSPEIILTLNSIYYPVVIEKLHSFGVRLLVHGMIDGQWSTLVLNS